jgi:AcrR family transcriptional regulator
MAQRLATADKNRERILVAALKLLLAQEFSEFTMEGIAQQADVSRLTVYYQFESKARLLDAMYDHIAMRGELSRLPDVFRQGDPLKMLHDFIETFARFWASNRDVIRRLHALGVIDSVIGQGLTARNERRRKGLAVIVGRYCRTYPALTPLQEPEAVDTLHMLTSFETFDALSGSARTPGEVVAIICQMADRAIGFS